MQQSVAAKQAREALHLSLHWFLIPLIAVGMALWPSLSSGLDLLQTDAGDTLLNLYFLEHAYKHFTSSSFFNPDHYWSPGFFWPIQNTLAWSDHLLGQSLIYGLFRTLLDPFQSYLSWLSITLFFNYIAIRRACLQISPLTNSTWLSLTALITSFSPAIIQQLGHPQLLSLFLIGPVLWLCHRLIQQDPERFDVSDWLLLASWLLANGFFNIYIFVYAAYGALICTLIHLIRRTRSKQWSLSGGSHLPRRLGIFTGCITLNLAIYIPYLKTLSTFGKRPSDEILNNLPKLTSWFYASNQWLLPPPLTPERISPGWITGAEQELFPGWYVMVMLSAALITAIWKQQRRNAALNTWLVVVAAMVICSLSISQFSLWPLISKLLPGASSLRASSRVAMGIVLFAAPAIALAAAHWRFSQQRRWEPIAALVAMVGGFSSILSIHPPSFSLTRWQQEQKALNNAISANDCDLFWYEWENQPPWRAHVLAMHAQLNTGVPTANGYSGHFPKENWPFTQPQGDRALGWITASKPGRFHELKQDASISRWCIASSSPGHSDNTVIIRDYDATLGDRARLRWIARPSQIVFTSGAISIGQHDGNLYLKNPEAKYPDQWALLTKDGGGIPARRGDFQIVDARIATPAEASPKILIKDRNTTEGIEYTWMINPKNGRFISQAMRAVKIR